MGFGLKHSSIHALASDLTILVKPSQMPLLCMIINNALARNLQFKWLNTLVIKITFLLIIFIFLLLLVIFLIIIIITSLILILITTKCTLLMVVVRQALQEKTTIQELFFHHCHHCHLHHCHHGRHCVILFFGLWGPEGA